MESGGLASSLNYSSQIFPPFSISIVSAMLV
jgi:hypothetical protein